MEQFDDRQYYQPLKPFVHVEPATNPSILSPVGDEFVEPIRVVSSIGAGPKGDKGDPAYFDDLTSEQLQEIYQAASFVGNKSYDRTVTTTDESTTMIPIPWADYDQFDMLFIDVNGLDLSEHDDYEISGNTVVLATPLPAGQDVHFRLLRYDVIDGDKNIVNAMGRKDYNTVAEMQTDLALEPGDICHTLGFYTAGDGGAAWYKVKAHGVANGMDVILLDNDLLAVLQITESYVTPEMFGAWGDGTHDDSTSLQAAINFQNTSVSLINGKTYKCDTTITISSKFEYFDGYGATIYYTGTGDGLYIDMSGTESHKRDISFVGNFTLKAPNSANALHNRYAIKTRFENIRVYDFSHNGIYMDAGGYECLYNDIYLACRKISGTVGITGSFNDVEFGNLFGNNVETFMRGIPWGSNSIEKVHAWCFNGSIFDDEPSMSDADYQTWFANTVLIDVTSATSAETWPTVFNYVNCDTYNTFLKWGSYWKNLTFNYVSMHATTNVLQKVSGFTTYPHYVLCKEIKCSDANLNEITSAQAQQMICFKRINGDDYEYASVFTYKDIDNNDYTVNIFRMPQWVILKKPSSTVTFFGVAIPAIVPLIKQANAGAVTVRHPWNGTNGSAIIYQTDFTDNATEAYALARSSNYLDYSNERLVKIEQYRV